MPAGLHAAGCTRFAPLWPLARFSRKNDAPPWPVSGAGPNDGCAEHGVHMRYLQGLPLAVGTADVGLSFGVPSGCCPLLLHRTSARRLKFAMLSKREGGGGGAGRKEGAGWEGRRGRVGKEGRGGTVREDERLFQSPTNPSGPTRFRFRENHVRQLLLRVGEEARVGAFAG